jgi:hypothetical protein
MRYSIVSVCLAAAAILVFMSCREVSISSHAKRITPDKPYSADTLDTRYDSSRTIPQSALQEAIVSCPDGDTIVLEAGIYFAAPQPFTDPLCGNCLDQKTAVSASTGFVIKQKSLTMVGKGKDSTILVTGGGYGIYIESCPSVQLINLKVTGGRRDLDGNATDASVVVRNSRVNIDHCALSGNSHRRDSVIVGIGGAFGREGAELYLNNCDIIGNGWDGVALYRGAKAVISDCVIKKGRGVGIGVTWDAWCAAYRNDISEYWKGIGSFGTAVVIAHNNLIHENLGWGIIATGSSYMDAAQNIVYHNGNCGLAPWSPECRGRFVNNIVTDNGWRKEWVCPCVGLWNNGSITNWTIANNLIWNNAAGNYKEMPDITGKDGNISADPQFVGGGDYHLKSGSPAIDAGHKEITDHDGSPSDLGIYGGSSAPMK